MSKRDEPPREENSEEGTQEIELSEDDLGKASGGIGNAVTGCYTGPVDPVFPSIPIPPRDALGDPGDADSNL